MPRVKYADTVIKIEMTNFDELIESASNEFELLQTIATVANYILNAVKVSQTYSKNIAEDLKDIANAKAIFFKFSFIRTVLSAFHNYHMSSKLSHNSF